MRGWETMNLQITQEMIDHDLAELVNSVTTNEQALYSALVFAKVALQSMFSSYPSGVKPDLLTLADVFEHYQGEKEYTGIVEVIQRWYYGSLVKDSWCATALSWALAQMGLREKCLGKKQENVYNMYIAFLNKLDDGTITQPSLANIKRGDIVIFKWEPHFTISSKKHVSVFTGFKPSSTTIECIGGNQDNGIIPKAYLMNDVVTIFRPDYTLSTLKRREDLPRA